MSSRADSKRKISGYYPTSKKLFTPKSLKGRKESTREIIREGPAKGLPVVLLDKVKNRDNEISELAKKLYHAKLLNMLKIIHCHFTMCPKPVPIKVLIDRCMHSYASRYRTSISSGEVEKIINGLVETLPEWITICVVRSTRFVKIVNYRALVQLEQQVNHQSSLCKK